MSVYEGKSLGPHNWDIAVISKIKAPLKPYEAWAVAISVTLGRNVPRTPLVTGNN